jgi:hypothetical protein
MLRLSLALSSSLALSFAVVACGPAPSGDGDGDGDAFPEIRDTPPLAPDVNDDAFVVLGIRAWSLVGNALTPGHDEMTISVTAPDDVEFIDAWVGEDGVRLTKSDGVFSTAIDLTPITAGEHTVLLARDGDETAFARHTFVRTHPLYVLVGTDWDDSDNPVESYTLQDELHATFSELKITHFVGPYTFTDPAVTPARVDEIVLWLEHQRDTFGDEIGVHIHPYCNFVETTDVPCRTTPSVVYDAGDTSGYTIESASYTEEEYTTLLLRADELFIAHGFEKPRSFRAGAWTADLSTLNALVNAGYTVDSDAYNWARMEEWIGVGNGAFYEWVSTHWSSIGDTSQPYYPSEGDVLDDSAPVLPLLEIPLNGVMADYVTGEEMMDILDLNWDGGALSSPVTFAIGYHPPNYVAAYHARIVMALEYTDSLRASQDLGPVVYATFDEMTRVFTVSP